jgi:Protein of unknown function (DUF1559)
MSSEQRSRPVSWTTTFTLVLAAVCGGVILLLKFPWPEPEWPARALASNHLHEIALAIINYSDGNRGMPPPAIYSDDGKPLLSWRVLILPYIQQDNRFRQFRLNEPWDSPHNLKLLDDMPSIYAPTSSVEAPPHHTFFRVFVGKGAAFEGSQRLRYPEDFLDGTSKAILVVDAAEPVPWTKPDELAYSPDQPLPKVGGLFRDVFLVVMADTSVKTVSKKVSEATLRAAITRNGRDKLGADWDELTRSRSP